MPTQANGQLLDFPGHRACDLDVVHGKLRAPAPRPGSVRRTALVNRLRAARRMPLVSIVAPAGYGKTTTLAQWAARDERPCAWISVDRHDDDPLRLIAHLTAALDRMAPIDDSLLDALRFPGRSIWTTVVPRLTEALTSLPEPVIVVLDHVDRAASEETLEVVALLAHQLPTESTLALAARVEPAIPLATLRADGLLLEVGPELLRLNRREAAALLAGQGVLLTDPELDELVERTEGWAAGVYLASLARRSGAGGSFSGADRTVVDYLRDEYLQGLRPERLAFLRRTSILESMSAPSCDELLGRTDSASELEAIERAKLFLVPLDREHRHFRYHHLFGDLLRHDLELHHPEEARALHTRAARWYEAHGDRAAAVPHLFAAGEIDHAADVVASLVLEACDGGHRSDAERWIGMFGDAELERRPELAALGAWVHMLAGSGTEPTRLLALADRSGPHPLADLVRSALGRAGPVRMLADARAAAETVPEGSRAAALARFLEGAAQALLENLDAADATLRQAAEDAVVSEAAGALAGATAQRALIAARRGDTDAADALAAAAAAVDLPEDARIGGGALELALAARALLRRGDWQEASDKLAAAEERCRKAAAPPWLAVQASLEIAHARLALRDRDGATRALAVAHGILPRLCEPGPLAACVHELGELGPVEPESHPAGLTPAELRLLPVLATHLSFREIGLRFHVSRNTIKTQAISVYRKLGVSSRSEAIERAAELGLLAGEVVRS
jgi:LuxR family transcriptional regulator, maltose regulon positive regulatory protein